MVSEFGEQAEFVEETFSTSPLAKKYGIKFYPAIFVNEILIAKPNDFFGEKPGRYKPWRNPENQERFRADLKRMVQLALSDANALAKVGVQAEMNAAPSQISELPDVNLTDLQGQPVSIRAFVGTVTLVEFWAEWCPPCRGTLAWLGETKRKHGERLNVLGIAVESEEGKIREIANSLSLPYANAMAVGDTALRFGDILSVPTLFVFDKQGKVAQIFYGAPPDLHAQVSSTIEGLLK